MQVGTTWMIDYVWSFSHHVDVGPFHALLFGPRVGQPFKTYVPRLQVV